MEFSTEVTIYVIGAMITAGLAFITKVVIDLNRSTHRRISALQQALLRVRNPVPTELAGHIDLTHPKSGEKITAKARFRIKN
jgi:hypothetical protein